jgi:hypothetical protein
VKIVAVHLRGPHTLKKVMDDKQVDHLTAAIEKGLKSKNPEKRVLVGYDLGGHPFYFRLPDLVALDVAEFEIKDL